MSRCLTLLLLFGALAAAQPAGPPALEGVGIEQRLGQQVPLDLVFHDEMGRDIALGQYFQGRPVLLMLAYYECPMLCTMSLNQLTASLNALSESVGQRFDIITVSFNPRETPQLAAAKKRNSLRAYRRPTAERGWHFLTGAEASIQRLTQAAGFGYRWDAKHQVYSHASGLIVLTSEGKISQYFLGVEYPPAQLRQALRTAATGGIGAQAPRVFLYCFHYDPATGKYGLIISRALQVMGVLTVAGLIGLIGSLGLIRSRRIGATANGRLENQKSKVENQECQSP